MSLLSIEDLTLDVRSGRRLLDGISLTVEPGRTVGLVGESGSGKSLTARTPLGLFPAGARLGGRVLVQGKDVLGMGAGQLREVRREVAAMVFQDPRAGINPVRTLGDHLTESLRCGEGVSRAEAKSKALEMMEAVRLPRPEKHFTQYPHELSGGQLQRVMIAGALMGDPQLLICDEPTTALDVTTQAEIVRLLSTLRDERGMGMLFITHDLGLAGALCDDVVVMNKGRIEESGDMQAVLARPSAAYTRRLVAATPSLHLLDDAASPEGDGAGVDGAALGAGAAMVDGAALGDSGVAPSEEGAPGRAGGVALSVRNVSRSYRVRRLGTVRAVVDASFELEQGSALGVVGESGSGKSTLARMIVGLETPDAGTILVGGRSMSGAAQGKAQRLERARGVQMVFQDPYLSLDPRIPVMQAVADAVRLHPDGRDPRTAAGELLERVGLTPEQMLARPRTLSGGQRQRVALARAIAIQPQLLVMDEATSALDVSVQAQVLELVSELRRERGLTVLFISHDLDVVRRVCDDILVLRRGEIVEMARADALLDHPQHEYTRLLLDSVPRPDGAWRAAAG